MYGEKFCVSKSTGLACSGKEIYHFCFVLLCGGLIFGGFLRYDFVGLIFGGAYTWRGLFLEFYGSPEFVTSIQS